MATPLLRLSDGTTTLTFADEGNYDRTGDDYQVAEDGIRLSPPEPLDTFAPSAMRDGAPLVSTTYPNTEISVTLKIRGASKPEMELRAAKIEDMLRTAREDARNSRTPRVYLEWQVTGGATRVYYDVLAGHLALPDRMANTFQLQANQMRECVLTLLCKPFCRGYERALTNAQSAIPREDTDPATDEGIGIFGDVTNLCLNPALYANVADGWTTSGAPDEFARYVNIRDSVGVTMPTCARLRADGAAQLARMTNTVTVSAGTYTFSAYLRGRGVLTLGIATDAAGGSGISGVITLTDNWTRHSYTFTVGAGATYVHGEFQYSSGYLDCFISRVMLAKESFRSPFVPEAEYWAVDTTAPGTTGTGTIYQLAPGHTWSGTAHNSASSRAGVDAAGTAFEISTAGLSTDRGFTFAAWVKNRGWAYNDGAAHTILQMGAAGANYFELQKDTGNGVSFQVNDVYNRFSAAGTAAQTTVTDTWRHVAITLAPDGTQLLYVDGTQYTVNSSDAGATHRIEYLGSVLYLGSRDDGTRVFQGFIQVQSILPYAATAAQVAALYAAGRDGNHLGYIEANNGANFDDTTADTNRGTATFTNLNGRIRLRDVQGQVPAPVRIQVYNNTATAYGSAWLSHGRLDGVPAGHIFDLTPAGSGVATADATALGPAGSEKSQIAAMNTSSVQQIGTFTAKTDFQRRRYRVLLRAQVGTSGVYFTAELRYSTVFPFYSRIVRSPSVNVEFYDLGVIEFMPEFVVRDTSGVISGTWSLYVGKATSAAAIDVDYLVFLPVEYELYWLDPRTSRWETDFEPYLVIDTRRDQLLIMNMTSTGLTFGGYLGGIKGDVIQLLPGDSFLSILGMGSTWNWGNSYQLNQVLYAPRYLVPPGL